jgi:hypothetical protein
MAKIMGTTGITRRQLERPGDGVSRLDTRRIVEHKTITHASYGKTLPNLPIANADKSSASETIIAVSEKSCISTQT